MPNTTTVVTPAALAPVIKPVTGTTYTIVAGDLAGNVVLAFDSASATTVTVPANIGTAPASVDLVARGGGQVTLVAASGVTLNAADGSLRTRVRYSAATLLRTGTNTWHASGDLVA